MQAMTKLKREVQNRLIISIAIVLASLTTLLSGHSVARPVRVVAVQKIASIQFSRECLYDEEWELRVVVSGYQMGCSLRVRLSGKTERVVRLEGATGKQFRCPRRIPTSIMVDSSWGDFDELYSERCFATKVLQKRTTKNRVVIFTFPERGCEGATPSGNCHGMYFYRVHVEGLSRGEAFRGPFKLTYRDKYACSSWISRDVAPSSCYEDRADRGSVLGSHGNGLWLWNWLDQRGPRVGRLLTTCLDSKFREQTCREF